jgi:hypothetical protein
LPKIKIRCEAIAKHSGKRCKCLGKFIPTSRRMLCPYHKGGKSWDNKTRKYKGLYKNDNIDIQSKINILKNLKNFKHKTEDEIKDTLKISLMSFYKYLDQNPKFKEQFLKAQEIGIKTLVEKMLAIFQSDTTEMSNEELLFLREKQNYIKWLAPRVSSLFTEKQKIDVKSDSVVRISWEDNQSDMIDVSGDNITDIPPDNKD